MFRILIIVFVLVDIQSALNKHGQFLKIISITRAIRTNAPNFIFRLKRFNLMPDADAKSDGSALAL